MSLGDQAVASATNFLTGLIVARVCSREELGLYTLGFSLVMFVTDMQTSLIATPYMVYAPRLDPGARARYTGSTLVHQVVLSMAITSGLACAALIVARKGDGHGLTRVLWALACVTGFIMLKEFARRVSFALLEVKAALCIDVFVAVGQIGILLLLARTGLLSAKHAYWTSGAVCGVSGLCWLWYERRTWEPTWAHALEDFQTNWQSGKWVFASGAVWTLSTNCYPWLVASFHGTASASVWAVCVGVVSLGNPLLLGMQNIAGPKISHAFAAEGHRGLHRLLWKLAGLLALPVLLLCVVTFAYGDRLLAMLYGARYGGNGGIVTVLACNFLVSAVLFPFSRSLFVLGRANRDFFANCVGLGVMVTLGIWLVAVFGAIGAAVGLLTANTAALAVRAIGFNRAAGVSADD